MAIRDELIDELLGEKKSAFSEYVAWMQKMDWTRACKFWKGYLKNFTNPTELPIVNAIIAPDKTNLTDPLTSIEIELSPEESTSIREFSQSLGITLSTYFQGLWGILLFRYSQSSEVVFGVTTSGRHIPLADMESRVGLFVNTVPLRINFTELLTPYEFFPKLQKEFASVFSYSHTPLTQIQNCSELQNTNQALFDSIFVFENYPQLTSNPTLPIINEHLKFWDPTHYALTFIVTPGKRITLKIGYDARKVEHESVSCLLSHIRQLCGSTVEGLLKPIDQLNLVPFKEYQTLISKQGVLTKSSSKTFVELVEEWAVKTPGRLAVKTIEESITYEKLNKISNQIAHYLRVMGVVSEIPVGLCLPRSLNSIIALLGIWKSGGVYVPLSPDQPIARLNTIILMSNIKTVLTERDIYEKFFANQEQFSRIEFLFIEDYKNEIVKCMDENPVHQIKPSHLAYILFTSGSTGTPKGVLQEHKTLTNLLQWQTRCSPSKEDRRITQLASISFDVSIPKANHF